MRFGTICTVYQKMHNIHEICRKYVSWQVKPVAWSSNDFCMSWEKLKLYTFTPFSLIQRNTLELEQTWECVLVVPLWHHNNPILLPKKKHLLRIPERKLIHPLWRGLSNLWGHIPRIKAHQNRLHNASSIFGDYQHDLNRAQKFRNRKLLILNNRLIIISK